MRADAGWWFVPGLIELREPFANRVDAVIYEAPDLDARRSRAMRREALQRANGAVQLAGEVGLGDEGPRGQSQAAYLKGRP